MLALALGNKMKIKDILVKEATTMGSIQKVDPTTGKVQISQQGGGTQTVDASQLTTGPDGKPTIKLPQAGSQVNIATQEEQGQDPVQSEYITKLNQLAQQAQQPWEKAQIAARIKAVQSGDFPHNAQGGAIQVLPPAEWEAKTDPKIVLRIVGVNSQGLSPQFQQKNGGWLSQQATRMGFEEEQDHDTIASGGGDIGGDAGDDFINDVTDKAFTRANRGSSSGTSPGGPIAEKKLPESDELMKWLTIAGVK